MLFFLLSYIRAILLFWHSRHCLSKCRFIRDFWGYFFSISDSASALFLGHQDIASAFLTFHSYSPPASFYSSRNEYFILPLLISLMIFMQFCPPFHKFQFYFFHFYGRRYFPSFRCHFMRSAKPPPPSFSGARCLVNFLDAFALTLWIWLMIIYCRWILSGHNLMVPAIYFQLQSRLLKQIWPR